MDIARKLILCTVALRVLVSCATCAYVVWEGETVVLKCGIENSVVNPFTTWCKKYANKDCKTFLYSEISSTVTILPWTSADVKFVEGNSLYITSASYLRDNGTFQCSSGQVDKSMELVVFVDVKNLTVSSDPDFPVPENTEMTFTCEVEGGIPAPNITWEIPGASTQPEPTVSAISSQISLTLTKDMNNQELVCTAQQRERTLRASIKLNIKYKPTVDINITTTEYYHGDEVTLTCLADGYPDPVITWRFEDKLFTHDTSDRNILRIGRVNQSQTGTYSCLAVNSEGNDTASRSLTLTPTKPEKWGASLPSWEQVVFPVVGLGMLGLVATVCYLRSEKTNDQDKVTSKMSNEGENVAAVGMDGGSEIEGETEEGAVGGTPRPELQGHYASIWFDPEVAGTSGIRRSEEPTVYAQIDFNASTRLIKKGKGKGKKSRV